MVIPEGLIRREAIMTVSEEDIISTMEWDLINTLMGSALIPGDA